MIVKWVNDPSPVWDKIKNYMTDDTNELVKKGMFLGVFDENKRMAGAFLVKPWSTFCYETHGGVRPDYWGVGAEVCYQMGLFIFRTTPCIKIVSIIPAFNKLMRKCVQSIGMREEGVINKAFVRKMKAHDLHVYGITRGEVIPCHR